MSSIVGSWRLQMKTPVGTIDADYMFEEDGGQVRGTASDGSDTVDLADVTVTSGSGGERVTWSQRITRPMRLDLEFDVTVTGDVLSGESRAGRLPRTRVTGQRSTG